MGICAYPKIAVRLDAICHLLRGDVIRTYTELINGVLKLEIDVDLILLLTSRTQHMTA